MEIVYLTLHRRRCPRCGGNVALEVDLYGPYWKCLQCGKVWDIEVKEPAKVPAGITK